MKKNTISSIIVIITLIGLLSLTSCKRTAVNDPEVIPNAGFRIILSGTANPSTLYVPQAEPSVATTIAVRALNNDGSPARGYDIVFEDLFGYGYFEGYKVSDSRTTDSNGNASIVYFIPPMAGVKSSVTGQIKATLVDNGRIDNLPLSDVYDVIPIRVVPYINQGIIIHGDVMTPSGTGVSDVVVTLAGEGGSGSGVAVTRPSGSYEFYVQSGWYGTIAATADGYTISPASYVWDITSPIIADTYGVDFIATFAGGNTLAASVTEWAIEAVGGSTSVGITNSTGDASISYSVTPSVSWLHVSSSSGSTPGSFTMTADENTTGATRTGTITVNATSSESSSVTITVTQLGNEVSSDAVLTADITSISASSLATSTTVNVYNSGSSESIDFVVTPSDSWITVNITSGSTDTTVVITATANNGAARTGTVTLTPTTTGVSGSVVITISQDGITMIPDPTSVFLGMGAGNTERIYISASDGSSITFSVSQGISWLTFAAGDDSGTTAGIDNFIEFTTSDPNNTGANRTGTIIVSSPNAPDISITVTQSGT
jgi:all-beta uncharacterized protein